MTLSTEEKRSAEERLNGLIEEIITLLGPMKDKATIVFIIAPPPSENRGDYAIFGNLPPGKNQELVKTVALDMVMKDMAGKLDQLKAMEEKEVTGAAIN